MDLALLQSTLDELQQPAFRADQVWEWAARGAAGYEEMRNLDHVLDACRRLPDVGVTHRRTAISTVGWIPGIERLADSDMPIRLALSVHAADEALRSQIMPVNDRYPLADVLAACARFY